MNCRGPRLPEGHRTNSAPTQCGNSDLTLPDLPTFLGELVIDLHLKSDISMLASKVNYLHLKFMALSPYFTQNTIRAVHDRHFFKITPSLLLYSSSFINVSIVLSRCVFFIAYLILIKC